MLIYQYPKKLSAQELRTEKLNNKLHNKKQLNRFLINSAVSIAIIAIAFRINILWAMLLCVLIGLYSFFMNYFTFKQSLQYSSDEVYTKVYDDRFINSQPCFFSNRIINYTMYFNDIIEYKENNLGYLDVLAKDKSYYEIHGKKKIAKKSYVFNKKIIIKFSGYEAKKYVLDKIVSTKTMHK